MSRLLNISNFNITPSATNNSEEINPFRPIGYGKPLLVKFHTLYLGNIESKLLTGGKKSILITSMIKDDITYEIPSKGVHQIIRNITSNYHYYDGKSIGTQVIYYTRALDNSILNFVIDIKLDNFNDKWIKQISNLLGSGSKLPIFNAYAPFILIGSKLIKVGGDLLNKALNKEPFLQFKFSISDNMGGFIDSKPGWYIGFRDEAKGEFEGCKVITDLHGKAFLEKDGREYSGEHPYILCNVDGHKDRNYEGFKATMASSSILQEFYGEKDGGENKRFVEMASLYNDFEYIKKIRETERDIQNTTDEQEKKDLQEKIGAYKANISDVDLLKILG